MRKIVVSDIFGKTPALEKLCKAVGDDVDIVDPYAGNYMGFQSEAQAYEFFMANMGLDTYCDVLRSRLDKIPSLATMIGFSVGASAIWRISGSLSAGKVKRAVCFYGSQVRHMPEINPGIVVEHILPKYEPGFSVDELATRLAQKKNVVLHKTPYMHGFMNELSTNYSESGYIEYIDWLCNIGVNVTADRQQERYAEETMTPGIVIRKEKDADVAAITEVTTAAFKTLEISNHTEQFIIEALRAAKALTVSLVAEAAGRVVGHIAFSPVTISDGTRNWYGLGPVSVAPEHQRKGIGKALVLEGLSRLKKIGAQGCCLVGHPAYYKKFGFKDMPGLVYEGVPQEVFLALSFDGHRPQGTVKFHKGFEADGR